MHYSSHGCFYLTHSVVVPGVSTDTCQAEIEHLHTWATANNLQLNRAKTKEIVL